MTPTGDDGLDHSGPGADSGHGGAAPDGAQAERTALAWRRTALAVAICALGTLRFVPGHLGVSGSVLGVGGLVWAAALAWQAHLRYPAAKDALARPDGAGSAPPGRAVATTAGLTVVAGVASLAFLVALISRVE